jgi:hypothetical protein
VSPLTCRKPASMATGGAPAIDLRLGLHTLSMTKGTAKRAWRERRSPLAVAKVIVCPELTEP